MKWKQNVLNTEAIYEQENVLQKAKQKQGVNKLKCQPSINFL